MQYVIYCSEQLDGIAAAAILARSLRMRSANYRFGGFLHYSNIDSTLKEIATLKQSLIFILDFSPENIPNLKARLQSITKHNLIAYWNSHHPYTEKIKVLLKEFVHTIEFSGQNLDSTDLVNTIYDNETSKRLCASELVQKKFMPIDSVALTLKKLARDIEFWIKEDDRSQKLSDLIASGYNARELIDLLSRGIIWSNNFEQTLREYQEKKKKAFEWLMKKLTIKVYLNHRFGFSFASPILTSADACQFMLDSHDGFDISCVIFRNGKISLRRRDNIDLNLAKVARIFNGGGHSYAAGGSIQKEFKQITAENQDQVLFNIDRKLKDFFVR